MSKNAPDTRDKLDNNKEVKKHKFKKKFVRNPKKLKDAFEGTDNKKKEEKPSKGQIFKKTHGYSKTMKRLLHKNGIETVELYRTIRKLRQKKETKVRQEKHYQSVAYKRANGKKKGSKGSVKATKTKKNK